jgi:ABC transporter, ATP-binding protein
MAADHIIVLDKGRVVEEGTHEQLLEKQGIYHRIYEMQSQQSE